MAQKKASGEWKRFARFLVQVRLDWPLILLSMAATVAYYEVTTYVPVMTAAVMSGDFSHGAIFSMAASFVVMLIASGITTMLQTYASARSTRNARNVVWQRLMGAQSRFFAGQAPEHLLSAVTSDTQQAVSGIVYLVSNLIPMLYYMVRSYGILGGYSGKLLLTLLFMIPINILYAFLMGKWQYRTNQKIQTRIGKLTAYLSERIKNLSLVKSFSCEGYEDANGRKTIQKLYDARKQAVYMDGVTNGYTMGSEVVCTVAAVLIAAVLLRREEITLEGWLVFYMFLPKVSGVMRQLAMSWISMKGVQGNTVRLSRILDAEQEPERGEKVTAGDIEFRNVSFAYGEKQVLNNLSFTAQEGKVTAIVGASGSGKTTILKLLERLYMPDAGVITLDGADIANMDLADYRGRIAYVSQTASMFSGSFRQILSYGAQEVSEERLLTAYKSAGIYDFIMAQPEGLDTEIAYWGNSLSGGQRQKLALARAFVRDADILLLDEPTSALDALAAEEVWRTIRRSGKTVLIASHDLDLVSRADHVITLRLEE